MRQEAAERGGDVLRMSDWRVMMRWILPLPSATGGKSQLFHSVAVQSF
ncbi:MAG: hypothetical protein ACRD26_19390 [Vicinamibacterales bacterium]